MDLGDFQKEFDNYGKNRYIVEIKPLLDSTTFVTESQELYRIAIMDLFINNFKVDSNELKKIYKNALLYFRGDERSEWDLSKGLFIHGGTGSGKSIFFEIFKRYTAKLNHNSFIKSKQTVIVSEVGNKGIIALDKYIKSRIPVILYIDDFGSANSVIQHYGNEFDVMDELIQARYDEFIKSGAITHVTTNVKPGDFKTKFNERITSRMNQMFNVIKFPDKDYRRD